MADKIEKQESAISIDNTQDDAEPSAVLPDSEIKKAITRVCKDEDIRKVLYESVEKYRMQKEAEKKEKRKQEKWYDKNIVKFLLYPLIIAAILTTITHGIK